jgi:hypothetical protein
MCISSRILKELLVFRIKGGNKKSTHPKSEPWIGDDEKPSNWSKATMRVKVFDVDCEDMIAVWLFG